jgi:putative DNA primase/helicase
LSVDSDFNDLQRKKGGVVQIRARVDAAAPPAAEGAAIADLNLITGQQGQVKPCEYNARQLIGAEPRFAGLHFDEFLYRVRFDQHDWTDFNDREVLLWLQATHRVPGFTLGQVRNAIMALAYERKRDSLLDFVNALPTWDRTPRIELAFHEAWGAPDNAVMRAASKNFFIALHARAVRPGAQVDTLWAFEGPQGMRKSAALRALGKQFHAEISAPIGTSDYLRELRGLWIAELSELDSLRGRDATTIKRLLSAPADRFVEKFEKHAVSYPRRAVAVASTNESEYWQDSTGARRLVPILIGEISIDLIEANRLQWFSEAKACFDAGETWWEFPAELAAAQEDRQQIDPWEDLLRGLMANGQRISRGFDDVTQQPMFDHVPWPEGWVSSAELMSVWLKLPVHQQGRATGGRLGHVMGRLGFEKHKHGKARERGWRRKAGTST